MSRKTKIKLRPIMKTWQIFRAACEALGMEEMARIYGLRHARQIYRWATDPRTSEDSAANPLDKIGAMLERLQLVGHDMIVEAALRALAAPLGFEIRSRDRCPSDKESCLGELLDTVGATGDLARTIQEAIADGDLDPDEKDEILSKISLAIKELRQLQDAVERRLI